MSDLSAHYALSPDMSPEQIAKNIKADRLLKLASQLSGKGHYEKAIGCLNRSIEIFTTTVALCNLAVNYIQCHKYHEAYLSACRALKIDPLYELAHHRKIHALTLMKKYAEAIKSAHDCIEVCPDDDVAVLLLKDAEVMRDQDGIGCTCSETDSCGEKNKEGKNLCPQSEYLRKKGNILFSQKQYDEAIDKYSRALSHELCSLSFTNRSLALLRKQKPVLAYFDAFDAILCDSHYVKAFLRKAQAEICLGRIEQAKTTLKDCLKIDPNCSEALILLEESSNKTREVKYTELQFHDDYIILVKNFAEILMIESRECLFAMLFTHHEPIEKVFFEKVVFNAETVDFIKSLNAINFSGELYFKDIDLDLCLSDGFISLFNGFFSPTILHLSDVVGLRNFEFSRGLFLYSGLRSTAVVKLAYSCNNWQNCIMLNAKDVFSFLELFVAGQAKLLCLELCNISQSMNCFIDEIFQAFNSDSARSPFALWIFVPNGQWSYPEKKCYNFVTGEQMVLSVHSFANGIDKFKDLNWHQKKTDLSVEDY